MKRVKMKILQLMIWLCDMALKNREGAEDQNDINGMTHTRNRCIVALQQLKLREIGKEI